MRFLVVLLCAGPALAQPSPSPQRDEAADIEKALREDQEAQKKQQGAAPAGSAPASSSTAPAYQPQSAFGRFIQSMNPDLSVIVDMAGGYYSDVNHVRLNGDDPAHTGFNIEELEVAFQATVDPYFRADVFLTVPNLNGIEVEEAFVTTTGLPANFQIKAGIFRAGFGRQNMQHLHIQDFTRRPAVNAVFLGEDGLHSPGLEINWLVPKIPFYLLLGVSAFSVDANDANKPLATFGGGKRYDFTYVGYAKAFFALSDSTSLYPGLSFAYGNTSQSQSMNYTSSSPACSTMLPVTTSQSTACDNFYDLLYGADLYLKWKPPNQSRSYASIAWQTEYFLRQIPALKVNGRKEPEVEGGLYTQIVAQIARRWFLGIRGELMGVPSGAFVQREYAGALSLTLQLSEFARIRVYGEVRKPQPYGVNGAGFLQLEASIGAHGAHPF
jgi:hypothetical protein